MTTEDTMTQESTDTTALAIPRRFARACEAVKNINKLLKEAEEEKAKAGELVSNWLDENFVRNISLEDMGVRVQRSKKDYVVRREYLEGDGAAGDEAAVPIEYTTHEVAEALAREGGDWGELTAYNANSLSSFVNEWIAENGRELPPAIAKVLEVRERTSISAVKI